MERILLQSPLWGRLQEENRERTAIHLTPGTHDLMFYLSVSCVCVYPQSDYKLFKVWSISSCIM